MQNEIKVGELLTGWCTLDDDTKEWAVHKLIAVMCPVSSRSVMQFQEGWDRTRPFEEFQLAQQEVFRQCVAMEASDTGKVVREQFGITEPLSVDTVLKQEES
jgi:hypothetical protein